VQTLDKYQYTLQQSNENEHKFRQTAFDRLCGLVVRVSGFDSRRNHIFWEVVGMERVPLSLVSTTEELTGRDSSSSSIETENMAVGIHCVDHMIPSIHKSWH
jgi:hypothetical protein